MTKRTDYTDEEWALIVDAPWSTGMALVTLHVGKLVFGANDELTAFADTLFQARETYQENALLQAVIEQVQSNHPMPAEETADKSQNTSAESSKTEQASPDEEALEKLQQVVTILKQKADPHEAGQFKQFILDLCNNIANASGEGFLGFGKKISDKEAEYLRKVDAVLGI